jgi:hypothetical protein
LEFLEMEPFRTVLFRGFERNRWKRFRESLGDFDHRAEAAVLMRPLRVAMMLFDAPEFKNRTPTNPDGLIRRRTLVQL